MYETVENRDQNSLNFPTFSNFSKFFMNSDRSERTSRGHVLTRTLSTYSEKSLCVCL